MLGNFSAEPRRTLTTIKSGSVAATRRAALAIPPPAPPPASQSDMFFHATLARAFIQSLRLHGDDDFVDRLNYYYTPIMLGVACLIISAKQYGGTPIECWVNPHSRESMEEYIESFCWITNTYWVPMYEHIPDSHEAREEQQIGYYQWVPFILIAEALMFSLPCILWRLLNWQSGINIQNVITAATEARSIVEIGERDKALQAISLSLVDILDLQDPEIRPHPSTSWLSRIKCNRIFRGHCITVLYIFIKLFYTLNIMLQFILLNSALKSDEHFLFGFQVLSDLLSGKPWTKSGHFPRVTLCDFEVRYLANLNRYTVQCALLINILNEKVFAFFWCWYLILLVITTCSTLFWITNCALFSEKVDYVLKFMQIAHSNDCKKQSKFHNNFNNEDPTVAAVFCYDGDLEENSQNSPSNSYLKYRNPTTTNATQQQQQQQQQQPIFRVPDSYLLNKFVAEFLKSDGIFAIRLIANHSGELVVVNIVKELYKEFCERNWREIEEYEAIRSHNRCSNEKLTQHPPYSSSTIIKHGANKRISLKINPTKSHNNTRVIEEKPILIGSSGIPKMSDSLLSEEKVLL